MTTKNPQNSITNIEQKLSKLNGENQSKQCVKNYDNKEDFCLKYHKVKAWNKALIMLFIVSIILLIVSVIFSSFVLDENIRLRDNISGGINTNLNIEISPNNVQTKTTTILTNVVATKYNQKLTLYADSLPQKQVIRAKAVFTRNDGTNCVVNLNTDSNWIEGRDGYFYYYGIVEDGNVLVCDSVELGEQVYAGNKEGVHYLTFIVESLNSDNEYISNLWYCSPTDWLETVGGALV